MTATSAPLTHLVSFGAGFRGLRGRRRLAFEPGDTLLSNLDTCYLFVPLKRQTVPISELENCRCCEWV